MNFNAIIAVLILKSIITEDEGDRLVEHLNDKPQSTVLKDAIAAVAEVIGKPAPVVHAPIGPVGPAQQAEELAARNTAVTMPTAPLPDLAAHAPEPELAANEAPLDADQADKPADSEPEKPAEVKDAEQNGGETFTPESDEPAKSTSVKKSTGDTAKK